jgi:hypothetical protein
LVAGAMLATALPLVLRGLRATRTASPATVSGPP